MILRCSSLDDIMTAPRTKSERLSSKAKAVIEKMANEYLYKTPFYMDNKYLQKGRECENESIDLFNLVYFKNLTKNEIRLTNEYITGECDLIDNDTIIDIKTSWDLTTFSRQRHDPTSYEWQLRGYMWLYDKEKACTAHCAINTPPNLCRFDNPELHEFLHIPLQDRIIIGNIVYRDEQKEKQIIKTWQYCQDYYDELLINFKTTGRKLP